MPVVRDSRHRCLRNSTRASHSEAYRCATGIARDGRRPIWSRPREYNFFITTFSTRSRSRRHDPRRCRCDIGSWGVPGGAVSENGCLCQREEGHGGGSRRRSVLMFPTLLAGGVTRSPRGARARAGPGPGGQGPAPTRGPRGWCAQPRGPGRWSVGTRLGECFTMQPNIIFQTRPLYLSVADLLGPAPSGTSRLRSRPSRGPP